jgi:patatin-like phospholipase/acyl hydrolase
MKPLRILSIDGGGIRGLIPALVLTEIEDRTGKPIAELFDIFAGTSTGGLLALGLNIPVPGTTTPKFSAADLAGLYQKRGGEIFQQSLWDKVMSLLDNGYDHTPLEEIVESYFGDVELRDALKEVIITAYDIERRCTYYFKSELAKKDEAENFLMRKVARATSAAPTYFEPTQLTKGETFSLIDGGVFANNPAMLAYIAAKQRHDVARMLAADGPRSRQLSTAPVEARRVEENFVMLSLGTGSSMRAYPYRRAKAWGLVEWVRPIIDILMQGTAETVDYQMKHLLPPRLDGSQRYYRLTAKIATEHADMTNASTENLSALATYASQIIRDRDQEIDELCAQLTE